MKKPIITLLIAAIALTVTAVPAVAIETPELHVAREVYLAARAEVEHEALLLDLQSINGPYDNDTGEFSWAVERWRPIVERYFPEDRIDWALRIIECESHGDPTAKNPHSTASGLFQHLASLWPERSARAGFAGTGVFDPFANVAVAAWLLENGGPGNWVCSARK
jgi:hypothetical protein